MMNFKIHRGTKEIVGSCVEVWTESTRIIVDSGMPLVNPDKTQFDSRTGMHTYKPSPRQQQNLLFLIRLSGYNIMDSLIILVADFHYACHLHLF